MKVLLIILFTAYHTGTCAQLFQQDFSASSTVSDYINASPGNTYFNSISTSGAGVSVSINANRLRFVRSGSNTGSFTRNTDMAGPPTSLLLQFDITVTGSTTPATSVALFYVGNNFSTTNTTEANADVFARFSLNTTSTDGNFQVRDISNGTNSSVLSGTVRLCWVMNNSGASIDYKAPDGTNSSIGSGKADIWGGTVLLFNDVSVQTPSQTIADIKFITNQGSQTIDIDNLLIDPIPPVVVAAPPTDVSSNSFTANWNTVTGVSGYRLDVSKVSDFTTRVAGYDGLYVAGSSTSSSPVTGLLWGNTYYYRVRSSASYSTGELESGHSNAMQVVTGVLPLAFTKLSARQKAEKVIIEFSVASGVEAMRYHLQRSADGKKFATIQETAAHHTSFDYQMHDTSPSEAFSFYRVAAIHYNGNIVYSPVASVKRAANSEPYLHLSSNPVTGSVLSFNTYNVPYGKYMVAIYDANGVLRFKKEIGVRNGVETRITLQGYQPGIYILQVTGMVLLTASFVIGG